MGEIWRSRAAKTARLENSGIQGVGRPSSKTRPYQKEEKDEGLFHENKTQKQNHQPGRHDLRFYLFGHVDGQLCHHQEIVEPFGQDEHGSGRRSGRQRRRGLDGPGP